MAIKIPYKAPYKARDKAFQSLYKARALKAPYKALKAPYKALKAPIRPSRSLVRPLGRPLIRHFRAFMRPGPYKAEPQATVTGQGLGQGLGRGSGGLGETMGLALSGLIRPLRSL